MNLSQLKGEIAGGAISALVAIPLAIGYGMFAFVGLGDAYFGLGMVAGLSTAVIVALACVALAEEGSAVFAAPVATTVLYAASISKTLLATHAAVWYSRCRPLL